MYIYIYVFIHKHVCRGVSKILKSSTSSAAEVFNWTHRNQAQHIAEQDRKAREAPGIIRWCLKW